MAQVFLGELLLRWCDNCGAPVLGRKCGACGSETRKVELTPPGDIRPGFEFDRKLIASTIDAQFGKGCGEAVLPEGAVFILNKIPAIDRMDEVILGGEVVGAIRYDIERLRWNFLPRISAARLILRKAKHGIVVADKGAVGPISQGANLLGPGVVGAGDGIAPGDETIVTDPEGRAIATGASKMSTEQMRALSRGVAVKVRWFDGGKLSGAAQASGGQTGDSSESISGEPIPSAALDAGCAAIPPTWDTVLAANKTIMENKIRDSIDFIRKTAGECKKPVAVSFSGGKDSLAALLLALDAGLRPKMLFIDTGLEFEETRKSVRATAKRFGLELIKASAGDKFWGAVKFFGPPGRDFRWCCKTCKLGPVTRMIKEHFPDGVLSLIGQRRYESEQRASKGKVWSNPWVPGQIGASPIQNWTALHVWLYLFAKQKEISGQWLVVSDRSAASAEGAGASGARTGGSKAGNETNAIAGAAKEKIWNPLYEQGFDRIGCWLCPASDMAEFDLISRMSGAGGTGETACGEGGSGGEMAHGAGGGEGRRESRTANRDFGKSIDFLKSAHPTLERPDRSLGVQSEAVLRSWTIEKGAQESRTSGMSKGGKWMGSAGETAHGAGAAAKISEPPQDTRAPDLNRLQKMLRDYADKFGYTDDWIKYGVWRWRRMPPMIKEIVDRNCLRLRSSGAAQNPEHLKDIPALSADSAILESLHFQDVGCSAILTEHPETTKGARQNDKKPLEFYSASGYQPCTGGISIEGVFNAQLDLDRVANLLNAVGEPEYDACAAIAALGKNVTIQKEGYVAVKGRDEQEARKRLDEIKQIILRAQNCVGCGVCIGRCKTGALEIAEGRVRINPEKCVHCGACLGKCPAVDFGEREFEF
ncbi:MAG: hypothetical protein CVT47_01780 [Thermoplasmata archaeon HGW-Thermoplasmata-2]|nr:MAG: hypothetical protein CVT47_01780 [Thermoplasmata archaeon HGW-Thermoplasmata-2]